MQAQAHTPTHARTQRKERRATLWQRDWRSDQAPRGVCDPRGQDTQEQVTTEHNLPSFQLYPSIILTLVDKDPASEWIWRRGQVWGDSIYGYPSYWFTSHKVHLVLTQLVRWL